MTDEPKLDTERGAWLTVAETQLWDTLDDSALGDDVRVHDVAVVLGAGGGGIAAFLRHFQVSHLALVELEPSNVRMLEMSWRGVRGVEIYEGDPVASLPWALGYFRPSVAVLNLGRALTDPIVVTALAQPNESLDVLCILFPDIGDERVQGLHEMLTSWHDDDLRWHHHQQGPAAVRLYVRL